MLFYGNFNFIRGGAPCESVKMKAKKTHCGVLLYNISLVRWESPIGERTSATVRLKEPTVVSSLCEAGSSLCKRGAVHAISARFDLNI